MADIATTPTPAPTRIQRAVVVATLVALLGAGLAGIEAWPLTGWRLFSEVRTSHQSAWVLETEDHDGGVSRLPLGDLPLGDQLAGWRLRDLPEGPSTKGAEVCAALAASARVAQPGTVALRITHDHEELVHRHGDWVLLHDRVLVVRCPVGQAP